MSRLIDISVLLREGIPTWPDSTGYVLKRTKRIEEGDPVNVSHLSCDVHVGTHIDTPLHHFKNGTAAESIPLDVLIGPAYVGLLPDVHRIGAGQLSEMKLPSQTKRLLLRTRNSNLWHNQVSEFKKDYAALTKDAAEWIVKKGIRLIGIDYLSIQKYEDGPEVHQILLKEGVVILEGLNLYGVRPGRYELICLPLKLEGSEGAPVRAVLRSLPRKV